jgi:hypothetical protein
LRRDDADTALLKAILAAFDRLCRRRARDRTAR